MTVCAAFNLKQNGTNEQEYLSKRFMSDGIQPYVAEALAASIVNNFQKERMEQIVQQCNSAEDWLAQTLLSEIFNTPATIITELTFAASVWAHLLDIKEIHTALDPINTMNAMNAMNTINPTSPTHDMNLVPSWAHVVEATNSVGDVKFTLHTEKSELKPLMIDVLASVLIQNDEFTEMIRNIKQMTKFWIKCNTNTIKDWFQSKQGQTNSVDDETVNANENTDDSNEESQENGNELQRQVQEKLNAIRRMNDSNNSVRCLHTLFASNQSSQALHLFDRILIELVQEKGTETGVRQEVKLAVKLTLILNKSKEISNSVVHVST